MRIDDRMQAAFNDQINAELYSAYLYYAMAAYFEGIDLAGMANWMKIQAQEELMHVAKFFDFVNARDGRVVLAAVAEPPAEWASAQAAFAAAYEHEQIVTGRIDDLVTLAEELKDRASLAFLQWFVAEQVEEEASVKRIADQLALLEGAPHGLFMIDRELASRTVPASPAGSSPA
ncbi:MAG: ferritin [Kiritimatiellaeota bacterium]|nr:ferritin [Kiritimatiellota bacterium]